MLKKPLMLCGVTAFSLLLSGVAYAQETATIVMRNGERQSGELVDLGGVGFTLRVNGSDRQIQVNDVSAIEFQGGAPSGDVQNKINAGQSVVVLRSGEVIDGRLFDIGGTHPLRITIDTPGGRRDFTSNDVAAIYYGGAGSGSQAAVAGSSARKWSTVFASPSSSLMVGSQPSTCWARVMSGRRRTGSSCGRGR